MKLLTILAVYITTINGLLIPNLETLLNFEELTKVGQVVELSIQHVLHTGQHSLQKGQHILHDKIAPIMNEKVSNFIPNKYIVVLEPGISVEELASHKTWLTDLGDELNFFNIRSLSGYTGYFTQEAINLLQRDARVKFIERDAVMHVNEFDIQKDAPWGLARVSHRENSAPDASYLFDNEAGLGVTAYVIDTGIKVEHPDFEGRAVWGDAIAFPKLKVDGHGHGTHCAGIIGSKHYGIAKKVDLVAVGVMNLLGSGSTSDIIKGVEFVVNEHQNNVRANKKGFKGSVVNMSIGGGISEALDLAVNAGTQAGLHIAVAAGNDNEDACNYSPARAVGPISVGASNVEDFKASFSNWGRCVDIFAPGEDILSTFTWSETTSMLGTSMASPHIAGLLAYYLSLQPDTGSQYSSGSIISPLAMKQKFIKYGTKGLLQGLDAASPNILAYNGAGANITDFWTSN